MTPHALRTLAASFPEIRWPFPSFTGKHMRRPYDHARDGA